MNFCTNSTVGAPSRAWTAAGDDVILIDVDVIEDPVEARRRIDRFLERAARRDVYGELLARGQVGRVLEDPRGEETAAQRTASAGALTS